jgi:hypothetical protein
MHHLTTTHQVTKQRSRRKFWLEVGEWIQRAIQDTIFWSINFNALENVVESGMMEAVGNWELKGYLLEEPFSTECMNIMAVATKDKVTAAVCFATLKDKDMN